RRSGCATPVLLACELTHQPLIFLQARTRELAQILAPPRMAMPASSREGSSRRLRGEQQQLLLGKKDGLAITPAESVSRTQPAPTRQPRYSNNLACSDRSD